MERPRGRGTKLIEAIRKIQESRPGIAEESTSAEPPRPRGRAALLDKLKHLKITGPPTVPTEVQEEPTSSSIAEPDTKTLQVPTPERVEETVIYKGTKGKPVYMNANYLKFSVDNDKGVNEYEVKFFPSVDAKFARNRIIKSKPDILGLVQSYDGGSCLYLPKKLPEVTNFIGKHPIDESEIKVVITFKKTKKLGDCLHLFNVLLKRVMRALKFEPSGRSYYDASKAIAIPHHRLDVLPGYCCVVDEYEGGLLLCLDTDHRVLRTVSVFEFMMDLPRDNFKAAAVAGLVGSTVLTKYNNKTYRVDDILWDVTPQSTFKTTKGEISYMQYYKQQYGLEINNPSQPLLLHVEKRKTSDFKEEEKFLCLIPEFCHLTGLTDAMRKDYKVMKDVAAHTRLTPTQRRYALKNYLQKVRNSEDAQKIFSDWGLTLVDGLIDLECRILEGETIQFGENKKYQCDAKGDWASSLSKNPCYGPVDLISWIVVYSRRDEMVAKEFAEALPRLSRTMGCVIRPPRLVCVADERTPSFINALNSNLNDNIECVTVIVPTLREDLYNAIKKVTCVTKPTASQVIFSKNLSNQKKVRTVTLKVALQINCKLGGSLWAVYIPAKKWMICGIDVFHSALAKKAVGALVCSSNSTFTNYFTSILYHESEIGDSYRLGFIRGLLKYWENEGNFPEGVVIYRDGVGDGQMQYVLDHELDQFKRGAIEAGVKNLKICLIVVQKRIKTRIFAKSDNGNPPPGTIVDTGITRKTQKDFFLVPQSVTQGTVSPTHYTVLYDSANLPVDNVQKLTYKMCHLYYNWSGQIRSPAVCQYAHKAAYLVGESLGKNIPADSLSNKLWYL